VTFYVRNKIFGNICVYNVGLGEYLLKLLILGLKLMFVFADFYNL